MRPSPVRFAGRLAATALAIGLASAMPTVANAAKVVGEWQGQWSTPGATATADFDLYVVSQSPGGAIAGLFDWSCTSGFACSGLEIVSGNVGAANVLTMSTTALVKPFVNLVPASYSATVSADSEHIVNGMSGADSFAADRAHGVAAGASLVGGLWRGNWQTPDRSATADFDLVFTSRLFDGIDTELEGYFDWTCTSGFACSGRELIAGTLFADQSLQLVTTGFSGPVVNLVFTAYSMLVIGEGSDLIGLADGAVLRARHVSEPGSLALLVGALSALGWLRRRRRA